MRYIQTQTNIHANACMQKYAILEKTTKTTKITKTTKTTETKIVPKFPVLLSAKNGKNDKDINRHWPNDVLITFYLQFSLKNDEDKCLKIKSTGTTWLLRRVAPLKDFSNLNTSQM